MIKYDNCKTCVSSCQWAGQDREFVCPHGETCKVEYDQARQAKAAADVIAAIKEIAQKPENLENLESYLTQHFAVWLKKYASTPDELAAELKEFARMEI